MGWAFAGARMGAMQFENFAGIAAFLQVRMRNLPPDGDAATENMVTIFF